MSEKCDEAKPRRGECPDGPSAIFMLGHKQRTARADAFQAERYADCARQERSTPAGDAVNWFVLATERDAERSIANRFTP